MRRPEHQTLERIAYEAWRQRGQPMGTPEVDWAEACKRLAVQETDQEMPSSAPGSTPTDLGAELVPENSHDTRRQPFDS